MVYLPLRSYFEARTAITKRLQHTHTEEIGNLDAIKTCSNGSIHSSATFFSPSPGQRKHTHGWGIQMRSRRGPSSPFIFPYVAQGRAAGETRDGRKGGAGRVVGPAQYK